MRRLWLCVVLVVMSGCATSSPTEASGSAVAAPVEGVRHTESSGGFSWAPPANWELRGPTESTYRAAYAQERDGFSANITIDQEVFKGSLFAYATAVRGIFAEYPQIEILSEQSISQDFEHRRLVSKTPYGEGSLIQYQYFLPSGHRQNIFIMTCTQAETGEDISALCDASAKSFRIGE